MVLAQAQPRAVWSESYGGDAFEELSDMVLAPGGGFIAVGKSTSPISGRMMLPAQGGEDLIALRVAADSTVLWEQRLGGQQNDGGTKVIVDRLGRYIIVGTTTSSNSGNKQSVRQSAGEWASDIWMVCLDGNGNVVWDRTFGGLNSEDAVGLTMTPDGSFLVAGRTDSPADGVTSRRKELKGSRSYWLLEVDPSGNLVNEHIYGGAGDDYAWGMRRLRDDTYMLFGASQSGATLDKTTASFGSSDMWLVQVRRDGSIVRDFQFGGSNLENPFVLTQYADGDIFVGGQSLSGVSGNKSVPLNGSEVDFWALRFELSTGRIRWDRGYGGPDFDDIYTVGKNFDDNVVVAGTTRSGNRLDGNSIIEGRDDAWLMYIDPTGEPIWDITRGGNENESIRTVIRSETGGWYFGGISNSDPFPWKDGRAWGTMFNGVRSNDMWIAKIGCDFLVDLGEPRITVCTGDSLVLRNLGTPFNIRDKYFWSNGSAEPTLDITGTGNATYQLSGVSADACQASDTINVSFVNQPGLLSFSVEDISCGEANTGSISLEVNAATSGFTVAGRSFTGTATTVTDLAPGTYLVELVGQSPGCDADTTLIVNDAAALGISLPDSMVVVYGAEITLTTGIDTVGTQFVWTGPGVTCTTCAEQRFQVLADGTVSVTATNAGACEATASVVVVGVKDFTVGIPNIFSPNNDGNNDNFTLFPSAYVKSIGPLRLFDRWGNQVFAGVDAQITYGEGWNGDFRGKPAATGAYGFVCPVEYLDGTTKLMEGTIILVR